MKMGTKISLLLGLSLLPFLVYAAPALVCPELTGPQKFIGFFSWMGTLKIMSIVGIVVSVSILFYREIGRLFGLFLHVPKEVYEGALYLVILSLIISGLYVSPENQTWFSLSGCLLFAGAIAWTGYIHDIEKSETRYFAVLFAVWSVVALLYQSQVIGFIAIAALMGIVGFSMCVTPLCYAFGFKDETALGNATSTAFVILAAFVGLRIAGITVPFVQVFESGAFWLGSFVMFLGLLIASSKWYDSLFPYPLMQGLTIAAGMLAIGLGNVYGIGPLHGIGGTFFVLYLIEKPFEIPARSLTGYALITLAVSVSLGLAVWWATNHTDIVSYYLHF